MHGSSLEFVSLSEMTARQGQFPDRAPDGGSTLPGTKTTRARILTALNGAGRLFPRADYYAQGICALRKDAGAGGQYGELPDDTVSGVVLLSDPASPPDVAHGSQQRPVGICRTTKRSETGMRGRDLVHPRVRFEAEWTLVLNHWPWAG